MASSGLLLLIDWLPLLDDPLDGMTLRVPPPPLLPPLAINWFINWPDPDIMLDELAPPIPPWK